MKEQRISVTNDTILPMVDDEIMQYQLAEVKNSIEENENEIKRINEEIDALKKYAADIQKKADSRDGRLYAVIIHDDFGNFVSAGHRGCLTGYDPDTRSFYIDEEDMRYFRKDYAEFLYNTLIEQIKNGIEIHQSLRRKPSNSVKADDVRWITIKLVKATTSDSEKVVHKFIAEEV